jgi:hypothetical protein
VSAVQNEFGGLGSPPIQAGCLFHPEESFARDSIATAAIPKRLMQSLKKAARLAKREQQNRHFPGYSKDSRG